MKRDMDLIRDILLTFEKSETTRLGRKQIKVEAYNASQIDFHIELMEEAGLIHHSVTKSPTMHVGFDNGMRLTMDGYDFLESIRDKDVWQKTKEGAAKVGNASIQIIWGIAKAYGKQLVKDKLGLDL